MSELTTAPSETDEADDIARLEAEIASKRQRVTHSLGELRQQWNGATSFGRLLSSPIVWVGVGLCLGFIAGYGTRARRE